MTLTACTNCGTNTNPGAVCPRCGTPTPTGVQHTEETGYAAYWHAISDRLRRAAAPKYEVTGILGFGGMAGVFQAFEPRLGRKVAIKVMSPALMIDPNLVERFIQEARTIALLNHPNIVTIYEVDNRDDLHWFTMAHVPGRTLGEVLTESTEPLSIPVVGAWLYQIADALAYAHQQGVVHRDIKPGNVLLDLRGNALVTDFGIAKVADVDTSAGGGLTRTGMLVGTPAYMSPEQCSAGRVTGASDQYSLGAVAYQMLTGSPPFSGPTLAVMQAHITKDPVDIRDLRPDCPDNLATAVHRMLGKEPGSRWPTMSAAIAAAAAAVPGFDDPARKTLQELATQTAAINVRQSHYTLREGQRAVFDFSLATAGGSEIVGRKVSLKSSDPLIAEVSGVELHALSPGATEVAIASGPARGSISVSIEADPIGDITIEPAQLSLAPGDAAVLRATVLDIDGTPLDDRALLWRSSNPGIVRVSNFGELEALEPGQALVAARTGGKYATASIAVSTEVGVRPQSAPVARAGTGANVEVRDVRKESTLAAAPPASAVSAAPGREAASRRASQPQAGAREISIPMLVGVGATVVIVGILAVLQPWKGAQDTLPAPNTAAVASLSVSANLPAGGVVSARDAASGVIYPLSTDSRDLAPGSYNLEFRAPGYEPVDTTVVLQNGHSLAWSPSLRVAAAATVIAPKGKAPVPVVNGSIGFGGAIPRGGAAIARDARGQGYSIERTTALPPGNYSLEFRAPGYEAADSSVVLRPGESLVWSPRMREVVAPTVSAPPPASVEVRGNLPQGSTLVARDSTGRNWALPTGSISLPPGRYTLEFSATGFESESKAVTLRSGQTEVWTPAARAITKAAPPPPVTVDTRADQAAVQDLVRNFRASFNGRDTSVVRLLPVADQSTWRTLFLQRATVTNFSAVLGSVDAPRVTGDSATVSFTLSVSFRSQNQNPSQELRYVGTARRAGGAWQLVRITNQR